MSATNAFGNLAAIRPLAIWDGVVARVMDGETCALTVVELDPDSVVREHSHPNEQLGVVLEGSVRFRVADDVRELGPGGCWSIPADVPHEVHAGPEGAVVIDVFAPPRDDWADFETSELRTPRWP